MRSDDLYALPAGLPVPIDDGACDHLLGMAVPDIALTATDGAQVPLATLPGRTAIYCYPRTGLPDKEMPEGWNEIPGARGCTPQSCGFRDVSAEFDQRGVRVFGLSSQDTTYQTEAASRLHLPFPLLSDAAFELANALALPTFEVEGVRLLKRVTLVVCDGRIEHVFYPVFPPSTNALEVLAWVDSLDATASTEVSIDR